MCIRRRGALCLRPAHGCSEHPWVAGGQSGAAASSHGALRACCSEEVAVRCPACSFGGAPIAPPGGLCSEGDGKKPLYLGGSPLCISISSLSSWLPLSLKINSCAAKRRCPGESWGPSGSLPTLASQVPLPMLCLCSSGSDHPSL